MTELATGTAYDECGRPPAPWGEQRFHLFPPEPNFPDINIDQADDLTCYGDAVVRVHHISLKGGPAQTAPRCLEQSSGGDQTAGTPVTAPSPAATWRR